MDRKVPSGPEFKAWRVASGLSIVQVGQLADVTIEWGVGTAGAKAGRGPRTSQCSIVVKWGTGERQVPQDTWELLKTKVLLLRKKRATFEELVSMPLEKLVLRLLRED